MDGVEGIEAAGGGMAGRIEGRGGEGRGGSTKYQSPPDAPRPPSEGLGMTTP